MARVEDARSGRDAIEGRLREQRERGPLDGRPLPPRLRLGPTTVDRYLASRGGPLPYMRRLRQIEEAEGDHERALRRVWLALGAECADDPRTFARRWHVVAASWDFGDVNELIERHNRCYPAEARLPMDPRTGDFVPVGGRSYTRRPLDVAWVLGRFPADADRYSSIASRMIVGKS
jgi:hypothetical protein